MNAELTNAMRLTALAGDDALLRELRLQNQFVYRSVAYHSPYFMLVESAEFVASVVLAQAAVPGGGGGAGVRGALKQGVGAPLIGPEAKRVVQRPGQGLGGVHIPDAGGSGGSGDDAVMTHMSARQMGLLLGMVSLRTAEATREPRSDALDAMRDAVGPDCMGGAVSACSRC